MEDFGKKASTDKNSRFRNFEDLVDSHRQKPQKLVIKLGKTNIEINKENFENQRQVVADKLKKLQNIIVVNDDVETEKLLNKSTANPVAKELLLFTLTLFKNNHATEEKKEEINKYITTNKEAIQKKLKDFQTQKTIYFYKGKYDEYDQLISFTVTQYNPQALSDACTQLKKDLEIHQQPLQNEYPFNPNPEDFNLDDEHNPNKLSNSPEPTKPNSFCTWKKLVFGLGTVSIASYALYKYFKTPPLTTVSQPILDLTMLQQPVANAAEVGKKLV